MKFRCFSFGSYHLTVSNLVNFCLTLMEIILFTLVDIFGCLFLSYDIYSVSSLIQLLKSRELFTNQINTYMLFLVFCVCDTFSSRIITHLNMQKFIF